MSKRNRPATFRQQIRQSMGDLRSIMLHGQSPTGDGRFSVRSFEISEPGSYDAKSVRRVRRSLNLSQALFAELLGVSVALVRSWELGTRTPAPIARRLLDQIRAEPQRFASLVRTTSVRTPKFTTAKGSAGLRARKVA